MKINISQQGVVAVLHCGGSLDANTAPNFKKIAYGLVDGGTSRIVVDCADLNFVDSVGLGALVSLLRRTREHDGDVKICAMNDDVKTIFEITRLHRLFDVHPNIDAACKGF